MKIITWRVLRFAGIAASALLTAGVSQAANPSFNPATDLLFYFQRTPDSGDNTTLYATTGTTLLSIYNLGVSLDGGYTVLGNLNTALTTTAGYGAGWSSLDDLYFGALGVRTNAGTNILYPSTVDPLRTVYYTLPHSSSPNTQLSGQQTLLNSNISQLANEFETDGTTTALAEEKTSSFIDDQNPITGSLPGPSFGVNLPGTSMTAFSSPFDFGAAGSGVVAVLDLYRMKPQSTVSGEDSFADLTPQFLGNVVLKDNGEVGFVAAVPEPSTYAMVGVGLAMVFFVMRRRRQIA